MERHCRRFRKIGQEAQVVLEYGILLAVVAAAFLAMSYYIKQAVQGQISKMEERTSAKMVGEPDEWVMPV